ncbi:hypothetical protein FRACYDRAFT_247992 [Fragilariopsis cylindrus CCMP1102]|uniref:Uncharacterized protein n=1 Tax=Fragilariopsis cylindrus CCMP1102 TaxID=635003 RepID=A0A1E7EV44_9STRA|nr:hypothetical protein FRACYDRAFT_247992 [Fragilariopsis cylindrus CCMP1102]|eukprot:OEU09736.1 hypothetical protein FRACYDRAFT_247992 [Fragilariopsis cylindrus CCMP1102]
MTVQNYDVRVIDPYDGVIEPPVAIPVAMTASPQPSTYTNQLPPFPPKGSDDQQCIAWSCGGIVCAIGSSSRMQSGFDNQFGDDFVDRINGDATNDMMWDDAILDNTTIAF